jgi:hypothetical protein
MTTKADEFRGPWPAVVYGDLAEPSHAPAPAAGSASKGESSPPAR